MLDTAVNILHHAGMSSDESETDHSGQKVYVVKKMPWRSEVVTCMIRLIDEDRNTTNGFGNRRPGNAPRTRIVRRRASISNREAPPRLPLNFYDRTWYDGLRTKEKHELKAGDLFDLPCIDELSHF